MPSAYASNESLPMMGVEATMSANAHANVPSAATSNEAVSPAPAAGDCPAAVQETAVSGAALFV